MLTKCPDILSNLPPEVALLAFSFMDMPSVLACRAVCKYWNALSYDSIIWRELFYGRGWRIDERRASATGARTEEQWSRRRLLSSLSSASGTSSAIKWPVFSQRAPLSLDWQQLYVSRLELERRWDKGEPKTSPIAGHEDRLLTIVLSPTFASLMN